MATMNTEIRIPAIYIQVLGRSAVARTCFRVRRDNPGQTGASLRPIVLAQLENAWKQDEAEAAAERVEAGF